ncbi:hypothetical protein [Porphyromonas sp.]
MNCHLYSSLRMTLLLVASLLLVPACQQQDPLTKTDDNTSASTWRPGKTYTSTLEALVDDSPQPAQPQGARGVYNPTTNTETHDALPFTLGSDTYRSKRKNDKGNSIETHTHIVPKVEFTTNNRKHVLNSVLALYDKTAKKTVLATGVWSTFTPSGSDKIKLHLDKVTLPEGANLDAGHTWYMMGFFGGATIEGEKIAFKMPTQLAKVSPGKTDYEMVVPFASGWRKVQVQGTTISPTAITGRDKDASNITFRPQALFFDLQIENYMSMAMGLSSTITMESNHVTTSGEYDFSVLKTDNSQFTGDEPNVDPKTYWQPTGEKKDHVNAAWTKYNGQHYVSEFKFNLTDRPSSIQARNGATPGSVDGHYIIAVMPFTQGPLPQTLFFGEPKIVGRTTTHPTNKPDSYTYSPETLTPEFGTKYLLGSTGETLKAGRSYAMRLRIIRPMLPIEHIYMHNSDIPGFEATRVDAESMPTNYMSESLKDKYRLPRWSEIGPILTINYTTLTKGAKADGIALIGGKVVDWGEEYRRVSHIVAAPQSVRLSDTGHTLFDMRNIYNWSDGDRADNQKRIYGLAYVDPNFRRGNYTQKTDGYVQPEKDSGDSWIRTNMYKCAVRIILSQDNKRVRIATYYLGPNLDINNQFYYTMHESFWTSIADPSKAVITRELPFNGASEDILWYWGYKEGALVGEKSAGRIPVLRSGGTYQDEHGETNQTSGKAWTIYWLKDRSW